MASSCRKLLVQCAQQWTVMSVLAHYEKCLEREWTVMSLLAYYEKCLEREWTVVSVLAQYARVHGLATVKFISKRLSGGSLFQRRWLSLREGGWPAPCYASTLGDAPLCLPRGGCVWQFHPTKWSVTSNFCLSFDNLSAPFCCRIIGRTDGIMEYQSLSYCGGCDRSVSGSSRDGATAVGLALHRAILVRVCVRYRAVVRGRLVRNCVPYI